MKFRSTAVGAAAVAAALAATLAPHPIAGASAHPAARWSAVADFAKAVADPADPTELNPAYNSGDFLHPNDAGYRRIAATINLNGL